MIIMQIVPIIDEKAPWKQRFRLHHTTGYIARCNCRRGLAISKQSNIYQFYAWDVQSGKLRQLTKHPDGQSVGELSSDGRFVYYLNNKHGNSVGHYVRLDLDTGEQIDFMPDTSPYGGRGITSDWIGTTICYITADDTHDMQLFTQSSTITSNSVPRRIYQTFDEARASELSYGGELVVIQTTNSKNECKLLAFDIENGGQ
jgi:hypothetical protein